MTATTDLSACLYARDGVICLDIPDGVLPVFLTEAFNAATKADIETAVRLLDPGHLARVTAWIHSDAAGAELTAVVLAMTLQRIGRLELAGYWYQWVVDRRPHALVWNELAVLHRQQGRWEQSLRCQEEALRLAPDDVGIESNLARDLMLTGRLDEGLDLLRRAVDQCPQSAWLHSSLLFMMHYVPGLDPGGIAAEHGRWGRRHAPLSLARTGHDNDPDPDRRLRIGYLSADFRRHSVAYTFEPLLDGRDRRAVEVFGYGSVSRPDDVTRRLAAKFDGYRAIHGLDDREVARRIEEDRIDILVAVAGHTAGHRLRVLAYKPAPIQVDYQGVNTTGIEQVDYRFTDAHLDPPGSEALCVEHLVRLPGGVLCFRAQESAPAVGPLPALANGFITFGSFNHALKINPDVVSLWARVLQAVSPSRLVLKFSGGGDPVLADHYRAQFEALGIDRRRIEVLELIPSAAGHLAQFHQIDVALDTHPFNGCMTTLEGLWMGVPIITLVGGTYVSRVGGDLLHFLGLDYLAASNPDEFVAKARTLARNTETLARLRACLRPRMQASALCDARRFAREVEAAYRDMWRRWCHPPIQKQRSDIQDEERVGR